MAKYGALDPKDGTFYEQHLVGLDDGAFTAIDGYVGGIQDMGHMLHRPPVAGSLLPRFNTHVGGRPGCSFQTLDLEKALYPIVSAGLALSIANVYVLDTDESFKSFWVAKSAVSAAAGGYAPATTRVMEITDGIILLNGITAQQNALASAALSCVGMMTNDVIYKTVADAPVALIADEALPTVVPVDHVWTMGPVFLVNETTVPANFADAMQLVQGWSFNPGIMLSGGLTLGDPYPRLGACHWMAGAPTITIDLQKPTALHDLGLFGLGEWGRSGVSPGAGLAANTLILTLWRIGTREAGRVAGNAIEHITLTFHEGSVTCNPIQADPQSPMTDQLVFTCMEPTGTSLAAFVTIATDVVIPGMAA
jgi:hypothetical protein